MPGLIEQILGLATIEQIETEQAAHWAAIAELQKQIDALDQVLKILVVARDGQPPKKVWSRKRGASTLDPAPVAADHQEPDDDIPTLTSNQQAVIGLLRRKSPLSVGEISHEIKLVYATAYGAIQKLIDMKLIVKSGDKLTLKV